MLIGMPGGTRFTFRYRNFSTGSFTPGTSVTPGASNAEGTWTQVASGANIAQHIFEMDIAMISGSLGGESHPLLMDIGWDPAGGTSYTEEISNIVCGGPVLSGGGANTSIGRMFHFKRFIPAGSSVAIRLQGASSNAIAVNVAATFRGGPTNPDAVLIGQYSETVGAITNSDGVSFTPGNTVDGSWADLGALVKPCWWWQLCMQTDQTVVTSRIQFCDLAFGDGSNKHKIIDALPLITTASESCGHPAAMDGYCEVPAGAHLYVRANCNGAPSSGYNAVAVGCGG